MCLRFYSRPLSEIVDFIDGWWKMTDRFNRKINYCGGMGLFGSGFKNMDKGLNHFLNLKQVVTVRFTTIDGSII